MPPEVGLRVGINQLNGSWVWLQVNGLWVDSNNEPVEPNVGRFHLPTLYCICIMHEITTKKKNAVVPTCLVSNSLHPLVQATAKALKVAEMVGMAVV